MKRNYKKLGSHEQHEANPFLETFLQEAPPIKRRIQFMGNNARAAIAHQVYNPTTNEIDAEAVFMKYVRVDEERFTKIYLSRFSQFWELGKPAIKVFGYIMNSLQPHADKIYFDIYECMQHTGYKHRTAINTGISDLVDNSILARTKQPHLYFINPLVFFNGDRILFADGYVKERKKNKELDERQLDLFKHYGIGKNLEPDEKAYIDRQMNKADNAVQPYKHSKHDPESGEVFNG